MILSQNLIKMFNFRVVQKTQKYFKVDQQQKSTEKVSHINNNLEGMEIFSKHFAWKLNVGWMDFGGWSPARLLHAGLNSGLMCKLNVRVDQKTQKYF
jgi:hypothetical protein